MKLLAIDASTESCSVALSQGDAFFTRQMLAPRGHAQHILGMVDEVLNEAGLKLTELDGIAFDRGPGSFTGVRISTSVCQGLAFGADLPVVAVSSLAAIAQGAWREHQSDRVLAVIDARMTEVYVGWYKAIEGIMTPVTDEWIGAAAQLQVPETGLWHAAGSGWQAYAAELTESLGATPSQVEPERLPLARDLLDLAHASFENGQILQAEQALPTYLRNDVAWKKSGV